MPKLEELTALPVMLILPVVVVMFVVPLGKTLSMRTPSFPNIPLLIPVMLIAPLLEVMLAPELMLTPLAPPPLTLPLRVIEPVVEEIEVEAILIPLAPAIVLPFSLRLIFPAPELKFPLTATCPALLIDMVIFPPLVVIGAEIVILPVPVEAPANVGSTVKSTLPLVVLIEFPTIILFPACAVIPTLGVTILIGALKLMS